MASVRFCVCDLNKPMSVHVILWSHLRQAIVRLYREFCFVISQDIQAEPAFHVEKKKGQRKL